LLIIINVIHLILPLKHKYTKTSTTKIKIDISHY